MKDLLTRNILLIPFLGLKPQVYESFVDSASEKIDSGNSTKITSSAMTSIRAMWHYFYIGLVCQNCPAYLAMVLIALSISYRIR